jgi:general secretion pathway protein G
LDRHLELLATFVGIRSWASPRSAKDPAQILIQALENALKMYKLDSGVYPSTEQGLRALVKSHR